MWSGFAGRAEILCHTADVQLGLPRHPPDLGEHNTEVLKSLGYSDEEVAELARVHSPQGPYSKVKR